ncbi:MAG TPA: exodeoxyribonuclease V subunit gamma, partial [Spirochaetota bacterium]|nr:exodeoxyribonuclease V subunit gamma [Spirochaetota bacterium]
SVKSPGNLYSDIKDLINDFLKIPEDTDSELKAEDDVLHKILVSLDRLTLFDKISKKDNLLTVEYIIEFISSNLENIDSAIGSYLTDGVTISSLMPLRPIPFKILYIVGLGEGEFPGINDNSNVDLRNLKRLVGDISKPDANRYLFLETIMSAKSKLYLSYLGKDIQKDQELFPNSLIIELKNYIDENILTSNFKEIEVPLQNFSEKYFYQKDSYNDILVNYDYKSNIMALYNFSKKRPELFNEEKILEIEKRYNNEVQKNNYILTEQNLSENINLNVSTKELAKFLENPLVSKLKKHCGIYVKEDEDYSLNENEPFYSTFPLNYNLPMDSLNFFVNSHLSDKDSLAETYQYFDKYYDFERLKSNTPDGEFAEIDKIDNFQ